MRVARVRTLLPVLAGVLLIGFMATLAAAQDGARYAQQLSRLGNAIGRGDWASALATSESWQKDDPRCAIAMFVEDTARFVTKKIKAGSRSHLEYPYSDKAACEKMLAWTQDLMVADPRNANYLLLNGIFYLRGRQDFERAMERFEKVIAIQPDNVFALSCLGACYGGKNLLDDAVRLSEKAIKLDPDCAGAYSNLGMVEMNRGNRDKAEQYFKKAVASSGADAMDWFNLGSLEVVQGRLQEGRATLLKAVELCPNLMEPHWNLASVYYRLGMKDDCIRECKKVIELAPDSEQGQKAKRNLQVLEQ